MRKLNLLFLVFFSIAIRNGISARTLEQLENSPTRPTMIDISESTRALGQLNIRIHPSSRRTNPKEYLDRLLEHGPKLIAALEKTYPHATWAFIGRDVHLISDLVEAFYLSIGQKDRVVRIGSSKPTIAQPNQELMLKYLSRLGFDLNTFNENHPFILIDTLSTGFGTQIRTFINMVYTEAEHRHIPVSSLIRKLNAFGLVVSTFNGVLSDFKDSGFILSEEERKYKYKQRDFFNSHRIITFSEPVHLFNESGYEHFTHAWHGPYGPLSVKPTRVLGETSVTSTPGQVSEIPIRDTILMLQYSIWKTVNTHEFLVEVQNEAQNLGFKFPKSRLKANESIFEIPKEPEDPELKQLFAEALKIEENLEQLNAPSNTLEGEFEALIGQMKKLSQDEKKTPSPNYPTKNGKDLLALYELKKSENINNDLLCLETFKALKAGRHGRRLRSADLKLLLFEIFNDCRPSISMLRVAKDFSTEARAFSDLLKFDDWIKEHLGYENYQILKKLMGSTSSQCSEILIGD